MAPSISFASETTTSTRRSSIYSQAQKKADMPMTISQKYFLAHQARGKLSKAASRADHDLRILCGHANLLDNLMINLASAEQEQERWYHESLNGAHASKPVIEHEDTIMEEDDYEIDDASSDSSDEEEDEDEFEESLALTRTTSRSAQSPPELTHEDDSDSEEEHMPPSPPNVVVEVSAKQLSSIDTSAFFPSTAESQSKDFFAPSQQQPTIIAAY